MIIQYTRDELLSVYTAAFAASAPHPKWDDIVADNPGLARNNNSNHGDGGDGDNAAPNSPLDLPYDWHAAFGPHVNKGVIGLVNGHIMLPGGGGSNNNHSKDSGLGGGFGGFDAAKTSSNSLGTVGRKNFLEVLRPDAPARAWDDVLGEWVVKEGGGAGGGEEQIR